MTDTNEPQDHPAYQPYQPPQYQPPQYQPPQYQPAQYQPPQYQPYPSYPPPYSPPEKRKHTKGWAIAWACCFAVMSVIAVVLALAVGGAYGNYQCGPFQDQNGHAHTVCVRPGDNTVTIDGFTTGSSGGGNF